MKLKTAGWILAGGLICLPSLSPADLIQKQFVNSSGSGSATGVVFQGSRNMRNLGKMRSTSSSVVVPSLNSVTVIPALRNKELQPKPRFGYGSDYQPGGTAPRTTPSVTPVVESSPAPVYQFRYSYPVHRDYWITSPYQRYFSPYYSCGHYGGWGWGSGFTRFSLSYGW
ncbi:MAG: hypothetical protein P1U58_03695 [Verrucomicrobiales bacterium]|nr:hypothetical protein [Verrucomicrobiales bacterium]